MHCIVERDLTRYLNRLDADEARATAREAALEGLFEEFLDRAVENPELVYNELALSDEGVALLALGGVFTWTPQWWTDCSNLAGQHWAERKIKEEPDDDE